ncbi:MAG TPA: bacterioferritin [Gammaproteobacteria bacterium]|nr:bacterioferritin [Gammaproteobacteria bacterium]
MLYTSADRHVLGYLGRALSLEFSAVQQYSTQSRLVAGWGLDDAARRLGQEASEELGHVDRIIARMLALGVAPNASQLRPVRLGSTLRELLLQNHSFEREIVHLYDNATRHCAAMGDHDNRLFFETLLKEEKHHVDEFARWLEELEGPAARTPAERATF